MHLLIPCLTEDGKFLYDKNLVQTNEVRINFSQSKRTSLSNSSEGEVLKLKLVISTVTVIFMFIHCTMVSRLSQ